MIDISLTANSVMDHNPSFSLFIPQKMYLIKRG